MFYANHSIPSGTNTTYRILNASDNSTLCEVNATEAAAGYNIPSGADSTTSIRLYAFVNTTNTSETSVLHDWNVSWTKDSTPPASITNLQNVTYEQTYINWTWTDPVDADFAHVMVYRNGTPQPNVTKGEQYYNATGLSPNSPYEIATHTVDTSGNINQTWVNHTAWTAPEPTYWNQLYFNPDTSTLPGYCSSVDVDVMAYVNDSNPVTATDVNITFDPNCVNITNWINNSDVWQGGSTCTLWSVPLGYVHITTTVGENPAVNGTVKIGTLTIHCNNTTCCGTTLNFTEQSSYIKEGGGSIYPERDNGSIQCGGASVSDLVITKAWMNWPTNCSIYYNITNIGNGTAPAGHYTTLHVDGIEKVSDQVPEMLSQNETYTGCFDVYLWNYTSDGYNVTVCADTNAIIGENNESNNCLNDTWMCGDVNNDDCVAPWDVAVLNSYVAEIGDLEIEQKWAGDVVSDGSLTAWDVSVLNTKVAGLGDISCRCS